MNRVRYFFSCLALTVTCTALMICAAALRNGDIVSYVLSTDIRAYINGYEISAYNIEGNLGIVAEDLGFYGFSVSYDDSIRTLLLARTGEKTVGCAVDPSAARQNGIELMPVLYSDISVYMDGKKVESYNIDGRTIIYFSALDEYGKRTYDDSARISTVNISSDVPVLEKLPDKIIHAGGLADDLSYTNSLEAINATYEKGFRFIELDFCLTSDGVPVCIHDWSSYYSRDIPNSPVTHGEFMALKILNKYSPIDLDTLANWMTEHEDAYIVTDVKEGNVDVLCLIAKSYPELISRLIPQIYAYSEYETVRELGYRNIILTLYRLSYGEKADTKTITAFAKSRSLLAVTADKELADDAYVTAFKNADVPLFVHTVNGREEQEKFYNAGVACVYTDYAE